MKLNSIVAIYVRVSTNDQNLDLQTIEINRYLDARGWNNRIEYADKGMTGTNGNRPALKKMLADVQQRKVDVVIVWKLDRLFRSLKDLIVTLQNFTDVGVDFISLKDNIDLTTSAGRLMLNIIGAFGQFERDLIVERVNAGLNAAKARGQRLGRPILVDQSKVDQINELRKNGLSLSKIGKQVGLSKASIFNVIKANSQTTVI